ncbi:hypothetical protein ENUP19_0211G0013 [Entamoeba nuttalli]|uniref:Nucleoside transporter, putative n=2 Tax=Entamoeba nuttalli TaxID=412467 RepID=K2GQK9_ENTNP|nr:nucleoside transporter, putative [Entamoeba nuttalli P19]EKE37218.1 nucleoside transporter, putative [Entamoeba nuttalli P19]|eukprot:XP_008860450.1 nucleoside transporter, putative [Entamoeba nuttalli P19]
MLQPSTYYSDSNYIYSTDGLQLTNASEISIDSSIQRPIKHSFLNPDLSKKHNTLTFILCFLLGVCYNFHGNITAGASIEIGTKLGEVSLFYYLPNLFYLSNGTTIAFLVFLSFVTPKYPYFSFSCISLIGQYVLTFVMIPLFPPVMKLFNHLDQNTMHTVQSIAISVLSLINGCLSAINFSTFIYISSTLSPQHLIAYMVGSSGGPFLASLINLIDTTSTESNKWVYLIIVCVGILIAPLIIIVYFFFCYKTIPHFHSLFHITEETSFLSINNRIPSRLRRLFLSTKASLLEIKNVVVTLKYSALSLLLVSICSSYIYPGILNNFSVTTVTYDGRVVDNPHYTYHLNLVTFVFTAFDLIGSILTFLPIEPSKKSLLGSSITRLTIFTLFCSVINIGNLFVINNNENDPLIQSTGYFFGFINIVCALLLGITQGYLVTHSILKISKHVEEKVGTNVTLIIISLGSIIGTTIQIMVLSICSAL